MLMKKINVISSAKYVDAYSIAGTVPVVIDVLRATTVMITAFEYGVKEIIPVLSPDEALEIKGRLDENVLLGGERDAELIPGFDLDNSPFSYMSDFIKDKTLVMTTTNGTSAIRAAAAAGDVLIASFRNAGAIAERLRNTVGITLICSGTNGNYTLEDGLCAGYIIDMIKNYDDVELTDFAELVYSFYNSSKESIQDAASRAKHYKVLKNKGFENDLEYCFRTDESSIIPVYSNGVIKKQA